GDPRPHQRLERRPRARVLLDGADPARLRRPPRRGRLRHHDPPLPAGLENPSILRPLWGGRSPPLRLRPPSSAPFTSASSCRITARPPLAPTRSCGRFGKTCLTATTGRCP